MDRPANDTTSEARVVSEVYLIDPTTKKPYAAGGGGGGSISAVATADAPTYAEGESEPLSMDLAGNLRIGGTINASTSAEATAAAPAYAEGTEQALSQTLAGDLRVIAKASGNFPVTGTFWQATQPVSLTTLPALATGANAIGSITNTGFTASGTVAHDAADSGNPVKIGARAYTAAPAAVANGDRADVAATLRGAVHVSFRRDDGTEVDPDGPAEVALTKSTAYFNAAAGSTKYLVATGAQVLTDYFLENPDASAKGYLQFFNAASTAAVTLGTTAPVRSIGLAAGEKANLSGLAVDFPLGLVIAGTTTATGSTTATTGLVVNLGYKAG